MNALGTIGGLGLRGLNYSNLPTSEQAIIPIPSTSFSSSSATVSGQTWRNGVYSTSWSDEFGSTFAGQYMFNTDSSPQVADNVCWASANGGYSGGNALTTYSTAGVYGSWNQIQLPFGIKLNRVQLSGGTQYATAWQVFGSNDGSTWTSLITESGMANYHLAYGSVYTVSSTTFYTYFRLVCTSTASGSHVEVPSIRIWGYLV